MKTNKVVTVTSASVESTVVEINHCIFVLDHTDDNRWMTEVYISSLMGKKMSTLRAFCKANDIEYDYFKPGAQIWLTGSYGSIIRLLTSRAFDERWTNNPMHSNIFYRNTDREFLMYWAADGIYVAIAHAMTILDENGDIIYHKDYDAAVAWIAAHKAEADVYDIYA
jgi:hypothetical protein